MKRFAVHGAPEKEERKSCKSLSVEPERGRSSSLAELRSSGVLEKRDEDQQPKGTSSVATFQNTFVENLL